MSTTDFYKFTDRLEHTIYDVSRWLLKIKTIIENQTNILKKYFLNQKVISSFLDGLVNEKRQVELEMSY